jgi:hypothetical protein
MFTVLQNKFSNYRMCSLCFNIKENIIMESFALLCFDILPFGFDDSELVYTIEACAFLEVSTLQGPKLHLKKLSCERTLRQVV